MPKINIWPVASNQSIVAGSLFIFPFLIYTYWLRIVLLRERERERERVFGGALSSHFSTVCEREDSSRVVVASHVEKKEKEVMMMASSSFGTPFMKGQDDERGNSNSASDSDSKNDSAGKHPFAATVGSRSGSDAFANDVLRSVVAEVCSSAFECAEERALQTLVDIVANFLESAGRNANALSELSGRTTVSAEDAVAAINASRLVDVTDLKRVCEDVVFDMTYIEGVPDFPRVLQPAESEQNESLDPEAEKRRVEGLPRHFPPLPPEHTYKKTEAEKSALTAGASSTPSINNNSSVSGGVPQGTIKEVLVKLHKAEIERGKEISTAWGN